MSRFESGMDPGRPAVDTHPAGAPPHVPPVHRPVDAGLRQHVDVAESAGDGCLVAAVTGRKPAAAAVLDQHVDHPRLGLGQHHQLGRDLDRKATFGEKQPFFIIHPLAI